MGKLYRDLVRLHSKAKGAARAVLNILADYATDEGLAWPGRETLASDTGLSERTVTRALQSLCDQGRLTLEENANGGRGRVQHYKICFPELKKGDNVTPINEPERVTTGHIKGDNVSIKGDKSVENPSYARREPQLEPKGEPKGERAQAPTAPRILHSRNGGNRAGDAITFKSPHVDNSHFDLDTGYIPPGKGTTAVEVYYERFDVGQRDARLNAIKEDDLVRHCPDLERLRSVVTAYSRTPFNFGNLQLILDWYDKGIPEKHRVEQNGAKHGIYRNNGQANGGQADGGDTLELDPDIKRRMDEHRAKRKAEGSRFFQ